MIGEEFIDVCLKACCSIDNRKYTKSKELFNNIYTIFKIYNKENEKEDVPTEFKDKFELTMYLSAYRTQASYFDYNYFADRISKGKFKDFLPLIKEKVMDLDEEEIEKIFIFVLDKRKVLEITKGSKEMELLLEDLYSGNYLDDKEIISRWETSLEYLHKNMVEIKKIELMSEVSSLDMLNDDLFPVLEKFRENIDERNTLKTGYSDLEKRLSAKGFEKRRLYMIGGCSGVGKSAFLMNLMCNSAKLNEDKDCKPKTFLYITAENLIDESWARYYCCITGETYSSLMEKIKETFDIAEKYKESDPSKYKEIIYEFKNDLDDKAKRILKECNSNIIFKYVQPRKTTVRDIEAIIDAVKSENNIQAVYLDYLDLFSTGLNLDIRLEQAYIAQEFKNIAVSSNVVLVTVTQLNKEGYNSNSAPSVTSMGESMKKVDHSDFVLFLQTAEKEKDVISLSDIPTEIKKIRMTLLKNRNGKTGDVNYLMMKSKTSSGIDLFNYRIEQIPGKEYHDSFQENIYDEENDCNTWN